LKFKTTGGVGATAFNIVSDSTCAPGTQENCSSFDPTSGELTAGSIDGTVVLEVVDADNSAARAIVTVAGSADSGAPLPNTGCGSAAEDGGIADAAVTDATGPTTTPVDSGADAGAPPAASKGGCSCSAVGERSDLAGIGWGGALLGLVAFGWRRRPRR
jgi:MYXO-CTERM domain-containing protein